MLPSKTHINRLLIRTKSIMTIYPVSELKNPVISLRNRETMLMLLVHASKIKQFLTYASGIVGNVITA
jgi:hypothetical protein